MVYVGIQGPMYVKEQENSFMSEDVREGVRRVKNKTAPTIVVPVEIRRNFSTRKEGIKILRNSFSRIQEWGNNS